ncbi:MAG: hypothetical protein H6737_31210 [Alphaproteobacteria bacterium]|nr:hypothetical protein [Alphaproteobacteria bacterium]
MASDWTGVPGGRKRFDGLQQRVNLVWSELVRLAVDDVPMDVGIDVATDLLNGLDRLLLDCLSVASAGGPDGTLDRAEEVVRMKRRVHGLLDRYVRALTGDVALLHLVRQARVDIEDSRALIVQARGVRRAVLAS